MLDTVNKLITENYFSSFWAMNHDCHITILTTLVFSYLEYSLDGWATIAVQAYQIRRMHF